MRRVLRSVFIFALYVFSANSDIHAQVFKQEPWIEDFTQLKSELSKHYANLDWAIKGRKLNLQQLSASTLSRLQQAATDAECKKVIESFLNAFGDGHLSIDWGSKQNHHSVPANSPKDNERNLCEQLNYQAPTQPPKTFFSQLPEYRELNTADSKYFPIGLLRAPSKRIIGVLRISIFSEKAFPDLCALATEELKGMNDSLCDEACEERVQLKAANLLTAALVRQVEVLKKNKIDFLLIDITGNGGGTNWVEPAARTLTPKALLSPRQLFIRHAHWTEQFRQRLIIIQSDLEKAVSPSRELLLKAKDILQAAIKESERQCNRDSLWDNGQPGCSLVAESPALYPQSIFPVMSSRSLPDIPSSPFLFYPGRYLYKGGVYSGPLLVLVDQGTWSSAEYFAAMLKDNQVATIIGAPTGGAGCGYTNGGIPTYLKNSGARVKIPDCIRLRADGSNEVEGITPDILIPWRSSDNAYQKAKRVWDALSQWKGPTRDPKTK